MRAELLEPPLVRLVEVDLGADEVARGERVVLAADAVGLWRVRCELVVEEVDQRGVRLGGRAGARLEVGARDGGQPRRRRGQRVEEAVGAGLLAGLGRRPRAPGGSAGALPAAMPARSESR